MTFRALTLRVKQPHSLAPPDWANAENSDWTMLTRTATREPMTTDIPSTTYND